MAGILQPVSRRALISGLAFALLTLGALATPPQSRAGEISPYKVLTHPAKEQVALAKYEGKLLVLNFWAPWCVPCRKEFPGFQVLSDKYADKGLVVLGVTAEESPEKVKKFLEATQVKFAIMVDDKAALHDKYVSVMPTTMLVDRKGNVIKVFKGFNPALGLSELEEAINKNL